MNEVTPMPLTATPPSSSAQGLLVTPLVAGTTIGADYAIIASGDFAGLKQAISYANNYATQTYRIYLEAGYYDATQTLVIYRDIALYGRGMDVTFIRQALPGGTGPGTMNGLFTLPGASLTLDGLTVMNGAMIAYSRTGGGVWVQGSNAILTVSNSRFHNNTAGVAGGGIYVATGRVVIENSFFTNNSAGAVYSNSSVSSPPAVTASCTIFDANPDRALLNMNGVGRLTVTSSNFTNNMTFGSDAIRRHIYSATTTVATVDAQNNYWFNPTVPTSTNELGVNTSNQRSTPIDSTVCPQDPPVPIPVLPPMLESVVIPFDLNAFTETDI